MLRVAAAAPVDLREGERRHLREDLVLIAEILVIEVRERQVARIALVGHEHRRQASGILNRNRLQQDGVDEAEYRRVRSDAERQGKRGNGGEDGTLGKDRTAYRRSRIRKG